MEAQRLMGALPVLQAWPGVDMDVASELLGPGTALLLLLLLLGAVASLCVHCSRPGKILGAVWGPFGDVQLWVHPEEAPKPLGLWCLKCGLGVRDKVLGAQHPLPVRVVLLAVPQYSLIQPVPAGMKRSENILEHRIL